ncbi:MAG: extracellular solute-binding protein [Bacteroidota bacterium]
MKKVFALFLLSVLLTACGGVSGEEDSESATTAPKPEITVLTTEISSVEREIFEEFTKKTGYPVRIRPIAPSSSTTLLQQNLNNADFVWTYDIPSLEQAKKERALRVINSDSLRRHIPADSRDPENQWFGIAKSIWLIAAHRQRVDKKELLTYKDPANSKFSGRVVLSDSSLQAYHEMLAVLIAERGETKVFRWANQVQQNAVVNFYPSSTESLLDAISEGRGDLTFVESHRLAQSLTQKAQPDIQLIFPSQEQGGTIPQLWAGAVLKNSSHPEAAQKLLEFLVSKSAQKAFTEKGFWFPIRGDVAPAEVLENWGYFSIRFVEWSELGAYEDKANELMESMQQQRAVERSLKKLPE